MFWQKIVTFWRNKDKDPKNRDVAWGDVQALVHSGYKHQPASAHILLSIENPAQVRRWLGDNLCHVRSANDVHETTKNAGKPTKRREKFHLHIAFTWPGLKKLGLDEEALYSFDDTFIEGMAPKSGEDETTRRAGLLADLGENHSWRWRWGGQNYPAQEDIHILLLVYASRRELVDKALDELLHANSGLKCCTHRDAKAEATGWRTWLSEREHFGFLDAISQPIIKGSLRDQKIKDEAERRMNIVEPGEFILGYRNERDKSRAIPTISVALDKDGVFEPDPKQKDRALFGKNGTFLVVRQLEQDVEAFDKLTTKLAKHLQYLELLESQQNGEEGDDGPPDPCQAQDGDHLEGICPTSEGGQNDDLAFEGADSEVSETAKRAAAEKLMGRKRSGEPLVLNPKIGDDGKPDPRQNGFAYHHADRAGLICPIGSHVRRANPRDSLPPGPQVSVDLTKQHRIIRRSRLYGCRVPNPEDFSKHFDPVKHRVEPRDGQVLEDRHYKDRGIFFICINADIAGQFEFIQDTWLNNPNFEDLSGERDPIVGTLLESQTVTFPRRPYEYSIERDQQLVTVRGGGYFFLPGLKALKFLAEMSEGRQGQCCTSSAKPAKPES